MDNKTENDSSFVSDVIDDELEDNVQSDLTSDTIVPGFIGWAFYGGAYCPALVISRNKKKKTAFVKFYSLEGLEKQKQIVNFTDIFSFHSVRDTNIIGDNDDLEKKYLNAKEQIDCYEDWLMRY